jgi:hypothetical protein
VASATNLAADFIIASRYQGEQQDQQARLWAEEHHRKRSDNIAETDLKGKSKVKRQKSKGKSSRICSDVHPKASSPAQLASSLCKPLAPATTFDFCLLTCLLNYPIVLARTLVSAASRLVSTLALEQHHPRTLRQQFAP